MHYGYFLITRLVWPEPPSHPWFGIHVLPPPCRFGIWPLSHMLGVLHERVCGKYQHFSGILNEMTGQLVRTTRRSSLQVCWALQSTCRTMTCHLHLNSRRQHFEVYPSVSSLDIWRGSFKVLSNLTSQLTTRWTWWTCNSTMNLCCGIFIRLTLWWTTMLWSIWAYSWR